MVEDMTVIKFKGKEYKVCSYIIERLFEEGITLNEDYFDYINNFRNPYSSQLTDNDIFMLMFCDYLNRIMYSEEIGLGKIVVYYEDDKKIYENLVDAILDNYESKCTCGFTSFDNKGIIPIKETIHFLD